LSNCTDDGRDLHGTLKMLMIYAIGLRHSTKAINDQAGNN
jgi:hypothetical protein